MTIDEICQNVRELSSAHGWDQSEPAERMLHVTAEIGEVSDALLSLRKATVDEEAAARMALGHEIFDAIWNLCALGNSAGVDLEEAARGKVAINSRRTWPEDEAAPSSKTHTGG